MVDVGDKQASRRRALAEGWIEMQADSLTMIREGSHSKGDVLAIARIAGIQASKKTSDLVPLCHPLQLTHVSVELQPDPQRSAIHCVASVETVGRTGVEMEALTAVQIALLTIYDMCKAVDRGMSITDIRLLEKQGGKSGHWRRD